MIQHASPTPKLNSKATLHTRIARLKIDGVIDGRASSVLPYLEAAVAYDEAGDLESAYRALEDAIEVDPFHFGEPYLCAIEQAVALGRIHAARGYFAQGLDLLADPGPLQERFGDTLVTDATLRVPMAETPYILAAPMWGSPMRGMVVLLDSYVHTFGQTDNVRLVFPAEAKDAQVAVAGMREALRGLSAGVQGLPNIAIQVFSEGRAIRPLVYRARAIFDADDSDGTVSWLAQRLQRPIFTDATPDSLRRLFG